MEGDCGHEDIKDAILERWSVALGVRAFIAFQRALFGVLSGSVSKDDACI